MVAGGPFTPLSVKAQFATSVEGLTATCDSKHVAITVEGSGQFFDLKVQPTTDIPPGLLDTKIRLSAKTSEQTFPVKSIPLKAIIHNAVETSPARISFGAASLGETRTQIVTLSSRNGKTFFVDKVDSEGDSLVVQPLEANSQLPASEQAFRISQKITQMGNQNTCAKFYISVESGAKVEVTCPVQNHGIGASKRKN
jgi:hypothetical protein